MSIGALSRAVGVPAETLRTWERRYGYPQAFRRSSGHRRYPLETVDRLVMVRELMEQGHKASSVVAATREELRKLRAVGRGGVVRRPSGEVVGTLDDWMGATHRMDGRELDRLLHESWSSLGSLPFMQDVLAPYLNEVGNQWKSGDLGVGEEHYASNRVTQFLMGHWQGLAGLADGPTALLVNLPGETHVIGLHMAAMVIALRGWSVVFLGADTPIDAIASSATDSVALVVIGSSRFATETVVHADLAALRSQLSDDMPVWIGGAPFAVPTDLVTRQFTDLVSLWDALEEAPSR